MLDGGHLLLLLLRCMGPCGFAVITNVQQHAYPVPVVSHLLASLNGGKIFAKLDLDQAYQQLPVDDATAEAQTIITYRGAFKVKQLQFGISVAPGIFQGFMEGLLRGLPGVILYFDEVLVATGCEAEQAK